MLKNANSQLHIAVCDDEPMDRQQIADLTREIMTAEGLSCFISCYDGATPLLAAIQNDTPFHILLFDVMMGDLDGIGLAAACRKWEMTPPSSLFLTTGKWLCGDMRSLLHGIWQSPFS